LFVVRSWIVAVVVGAAACRPGAADLAKYPDAPLQLRDDSDRQQATDQLWVLPPGARRDAARAEVAAAIARRLDDALQEDQPVAAESLVFELAGLWQDDPGAIGRGLAPHVELLHRLRATFAKSGALEPAVATLAMLAEVEPDRRAARLAEIDEILEFAGAVAAGQGVTGGFDAERARPVALLQPTALAVPLPWLVDRYVGVLEQRQRVVSQEFSSKHSFDLVGEAHDVLLTARRITVVLARAGRTAEIAKHLAPLDGIGADAALKTRTEAIVMTHATADAYIDLATLLRSDDHGQAPDATAALAVCRAGLVRFPTDAGLLAAAAESSAALGRVEQPIVLYRAALEASKGTLDRATAMRLGRLVSERIARLAFGGRPAAARTAWRELAHYADQERERNGDKIVWSQVEAVAETALGRGLLSQGRIHEAEVSLVASLDRAPSIDAYETLTTIYFKTGRLSSASHSASAGLAMLGETSGDHYRRAKLERLAGDVMRTAGKSRDAAALYLDSLRTWASLGDDRGLPRSVAAERKLEFARGMWYLGSSDRAVDLALEATELAPEAGTTTVDTVAFLLEVGKPTDALDAVHRGLGAPDLGELDKVYICLWVLADARHRGDPRDRQAWDYIASRHGDLWYELLAESASGRLDWSTLAAAATTGPRQAELAFYGFALGLDPDAKNPANAHKLLERAIDAHLVMDAEYDLALQYLTTP
jgi:tetratricopeptide (TPR) repeat protein